MWGFYRVPFVPVQFDVISSRMNMPVANTTPDDKPVATEPSATTTEPPKPKMKRWPDNRSTLLPYCDLIAPIKEVLYKGYSLNRKDAKSFDYTGYNIGKSELHDNPSPRFRLSEKFLAFENKLGHKLIDVLFNIVFLLGVEQGRRAEHRDMLPMETMLNTLETYREKNKDQRIRIDELEITLELKDKYPNISKEEFDRRLKHHMRERRLKRIDTMKAELKLDNTRSLFNLKSPQRAKFKDLENLAKTLTKKHCTQEQWEDILAEKGWTTKEWKAKCKKKFSFNDFV